MARLGLGAHSISDVIYRPYFLICLILFILEYWFRLRTHSHQRLKIKDDRRVLINSFYLFDTTEQMKRHPANLKYGLGDKTFFDELQASQKEVHVSPVESRNLVGANINIVNGERITKRHKFDQVEDQSDEHWIFLGGSTVLCLEVPDSMTLTSCVQAIVDRSSNNEIQVHNFGQAGFKAVKIEQLFPLFLSRYTKVTRVIVYFGVNDAGWIAGSRPSNRLTYLCDAVLDKLSVFSKLVAFATLRMRSRRVCKASTEYANKTLRKFLAYKDYFETRGVLINFILQPNVFCKSHPSKLELSYIDQAEPLRIAGLHAAYNTYLSHSDGLITSAVDTFSDISETIFFDWCHVGVEGNSIISRKIWDLINDHSVSESRTVAAMNVMKNYRNIALRSRNIFKNKDETVYNYPLY